MAVKKSNYVYDFMVNLIEHEYYTREEAVERADVFYIAHRLNSKEYMELCDLIDRVYGVKKKDEEESPEEETKDNVEEETKDKVGEEIEKNN